MERHNLMRNGVLRLPPGFRFHPTDEELVVQYLRRKVLSYPLPASVIPEFDVYTSDPWDLPGDRGGGQERYFFSTSEVKYPNRSNRAAGSGYWKSTGSDKQIVVSSSHNKHHQIQSPVGIKKTLVFYRAKPSSGPRRTDWVMHEYRLTNLPQEKWILCRIFLKRSRKNNESLVPVLHDFTNVVDEAGANSSSDASSGITTTDIYNDDDDNDDNREHNSSNLGELGTHVLK